MSFNTNTPGLPDTPPVPPVSGEQGFRRDRRVAPTSTPSTSPYPAPASGVDVAAAMEVINRVSSSYERKLVGQTSLKTSLLVSLIAGGHVLLESLPGLAKTTASQSLAESVQATFKRIQCTPDLLPSDIIGTQIYDAVNQTFKTQLGPVHANFVLLDEINRSSAKTQSAMLEAMQEKQTSIGGEIFPLPKPFMVIATQNPIEQEGTYELPEAQLDRFLLKEIVNYPTLEEELEVLKRIDTGALDADSHLSSVVSLDEVVWLQKEAAKVKIDDSIYKYIINIVSSTRQIGEILGSDFAPLVRCGASPRASIAFMKAARALALMNGRDFVVPDDIKALRHPILRHRLILSYEAELKNETAETIIDRLFNEVPAP